MEHTRIDTDALRDPARRPLRVCLATPWDTACGIAEHSRMLKAAIEMADPLIEVLPLPAAVDPKSEDRGGWDVLHLNYQAALHSRWTPEAIRNAREPIGGLRGPRPVVVTYHDTGVPNSDQCKGVIAAADAAVVHEPFDDLPAEKTYYWRMGVPAARLPWQFDGRDRVRPILGTVGFPFSWKCYDELARVTGEIGWGLMILAPGATEADVWRWHALNPHTLVETQFLTQGEVQSRLAGCDATAFTYVCHNTGQSGAILQGIAARKPVIALRTCRQMRALALDALGELAIHWCETFEDVARTLQFLHLSDRPDPATVALAHQERWSLRGEWYAALYRKVVADREVQR